jgi:hypothetical protein
LQRPPGGQGTPFELGMHPRRVLTEPDRDPASPAGAVRADDPRPAAPAADRLPQPSLSEEQDRLMAEILQTAWNGTLPNSTPVDFALLRTAEHRDAQVRHDFTRLLHWASTCGVKAIAVEDLDFTAEKTREKHGRKKRFR